jgi:hypothetical protein
MQAHGTTETGLVGFSLAEMMIAVAIVVGVAGAVLHLFVQNERLIRDESIALEMRQGLRAVASMIADELYMAGMGVPLFSARHEQLGSEPVQTFLAGTDQTTVRMRVNLDQSSGVLGDAVPLLFETGVARTVLSDAAFRPSPGGHVFFWGQTRGSWTWVRARVESLSPGRVLTVTPTELSSESGLLTSRVRVAEEDALSYHLSDRTVRRGELTSLSNPMEPRFRESSVGDHFTALEFVYHDAAGQVVDPSSDDGRAAIRSIDFLLEAETSQALSNGTRPRQAVTMTVTPPSLGI